MLPPLLHRFILGGVLTAPYYNENYIGVPRHVLSSLMTWIFRYEGDIMINLSKCANDFLIQMPKTIAPF